MGIVWTEMGWADAPHRHRRTYIPPFKSTTTQFVRIKLVEASDRVLMMFDEALQAEAIKQLTSAPQKLLEQVHVHASMPGLPIAPIVETGANTKPSK